MDVTGTILQAIEASGLSERQVSIKAFGHDTAIRDLKRSGAMSSARLERLCQLLDLEFYVGRKREEGPAQEANLIESLRGALGLPHDTEVSSVINHTMKAISRSAEDQVLMHLKRIDERLDYALQKTIDQEDDRVAMPLYDIRAAAGDGAAVEFEQIDAWLYFRRDWLLKNSLTIGQCGLVRVTGDSMEPTLVADDVILVDFTSRDPMHSRIYLVRDGDDLQVKRILADPDSGFVLHSDNPTYEARPMTDSSIIIGRVSWSGRTFTNAPEALRVVR